VRISGLNMTITCRDDNNNTLPESDLLDLLINVDAMKGKGLTYDGKLSSTAYPYLSGTLTIVRGLDKKIEILRSMYPNLNVIEINSVISYTASYYLNEEDALNKTNVYYTAYLILEEGMTDTVLGDDPVYIGLCPAPTKKPTISKQYYFGTNVNTYYPWSGWKIKDSAATPRADMTVKNDINLIAVFGE